MVPMPEETKDDPGHVTRAECNKTVAKFNGELQTIKKALIGDDMRGGVVKDVSEIKAATSIVKTVFLPIILSVSASIIVYLIVNTI
jgi:hypothetical protein